MPHALSDPAAAGFNGLKPINVVVPLRRCGKKYQHQKA